MTGGLTAVLIEDATAIRLGLPALLPDITFVAAFARTEEALRARPAADIVILDLHLANSGQRDATQGVAAVTDLVSAGYRVCLYTQEERRFVLAACLAAGARGLIRKSLPLPEVAEAIAQFAAGRVVVPQSLVALTELLVRRGSLTILSPRQRQVLAGRARGQTYTEMSRAMHLSESTLRGYWHDLAAIAADHLQQTAPADIERSLGLAPGDLLDFWPSRRPARPG
ncbi:MULTISPECIES: DNA-binding response regulator [unclassified Streptomyces]|uniref:DNA-binding response regulator n=1 Tax=unclassified Streptomyces TaxID=2593676 RepID=UPI0022385578|nr:DNA-binding response regulator [Streptomyces sp. SHP 1-2]MCW5251405.1 response regulator transcription factor [Streptomyces sp. SHP 1-2]